VWNVRQGDELKSRKNFLQLVGIAIAILAVEKDDWIEADERKPPGLFASFGGFKRKTRLSVVDLGEAETGFQLGHKFDNHWDEIAAFGEGTELVASGRYTRLIRDGVWRKTCPTGLQISPKSIARVYPRMRNMIQDQGQNFEVCADFPQL